MSRSPWSERTSTRRSEASIYATAAIGLIVFTMLGWWWLS